MLSEAFDRPGATERCSPRLDAMRPVRTVRGGPALTSGSDRRRRVRMGGRADVDSMFRVEDAMNVCFLLTILRT